jgi:galactokinase
VSAAASAAFAPGRVNLIGDHTDYTGGWVLPLAIEQGTTVRLAPGGDTVRLRSADEPGEAVVPVGRPDPAAATGWARYVAGCVAEAAPTTGAAGSVSTTLPIGAGLSSSAALEVALILALGHTGGPLELARAAQRAEQRASGVPCGLMDQLASAAGVDGAALLIDCTSDEFRPVPIPDGCEIRVVHSGQSRTLAGSAYAERRAQCEAAARLIGPLRQAGLDDAGAIGDPAIQRRARHVISENARVLAAADRLTVGDLAAVGELMKRSHASLRDDFEVSSPALDGLVEQLSGRPGVFGARLTGAGFGGCVVALTEPGALDVGWAVRAGAGAHRLG